MRELLWAVAFASAMPAVSSAEVSVLPQWKEGELEIHHIYTGRGESNFVIMPDGTTMLIDAGDYDPKGAWNMTEWLPDSSRRAGEWIARYVERVNPAKDKKAVDYLMVSHMHNDHMGDCVDIDVPFTKGRNPDYKIVGLAEAGEYLHFGTAFDRGYPDYDYPLPVKKDPGIDSYKDVENYLDMVAWQKDKYGLRQEKFRPGALNEIALRHHPGKYKGKFGIRNLAANAEVWTGEGEKTVRYYDLHPENPTDYPNENTKSLAVRIDYGPFSYYTGGDVSGRLFDKDRTPFYVEEKVGAACGKVDVAKANHHGHPSGSVKGFLDNVKATNFVLPVWDYWHTQKPVIERMVAAGCNPGEPYNIFATAVHKKWYAEHGDEDWLKAICPVTGHVVVKVYDGGKKYKIYIVSAEDESMTVKGEYGPFKSESSHLQAR